MNISRDIVNIWKKKWNSGKVMILIGPRQVGKTTLIKSICESEGDYLFVNGDSQEEKDAGNNSVNGNRSQ